MTERKHESHSNRTLALLHQFARHVVDGGDVVGIHGMPQAKTIGKKRGPQQQRVLAKREDRPNPRGHIEDEQDAVDAGDLGAEIACGVVEQATECACHHGSWSW